MKKEQGFTLVEILAVIIILSVIALIAIPNVSVAVETSRKKAYVEIANRYVNAVREEISSGKIKVNDENTSYYISYKLIDVEKGDRSPYGQWKEAYVVAAYNDHNSKIDYYWTSIDATGHKIILKNIEDITIDDIIVDTTLSSIDRRRVGARDSVLTINENGEETVTAPVLSVTNVEADQCYTYYDNADGTITIESYKRECPKEVEIPSKIGGKSVTIIGSSAFYNEGLTTVILPEGLTTINGSAFRSNKITNVVYPYTLTSIGGEAFAYNQLTEIALKAPATLGSGAYTGNKIDEANAIIYKQLSDGTTDYSIIIGYAGTQRDLVIPPSHYNSKTGQQVPLKTIGSGAFRSCKLTSVAIPASVTRIESTAFQNNSLQSIVFPEGLEFIGSYSFSDNKLSSLTIPDSVKTIEDRAFTNNRIPAGNDNEFVYARRASASGGGEWDYSRIGSYAGSNDNVSIPMTKNGVTLTTIGSHAFISCGLTDLEIPPSVTSIGSLAFTSNKLPDSKAFIYKRNSDGSENRAVIIGYAGAKRENIVIPEGVEELGSSSFSWNSIKSITLPSTLKKIGSKAFAYNKLKSITIPSGVTSIGSNAFLISYPYGPYNHGFEAVHNLTGRAFDWKSIFGGRFDANFATGTIHHQYGNIVVYGS